MESAMELARESFLKDEVPVGAVVVKENIIIGRGRNTVIADNDVINIVIKKIISILSLNLFIK